ncbi:hypothetical protein B484DRAFT_457224 [Ochromonadaceae sp. CCMP2298]|nr:hypothetical protein B484DRAFT_457224 [Ochromonadaceae sp. CCMP2298]|mmetsp:Transcript_15896/g.35182  ORF Transcript_15896/g.35182 Transcript_15896/m.35182 type:complete len:245 (-) Transcript_15896:257-991(-)
MQRLFLTESATEPLPLTDRSICQVAAHCPSLTVLDVSYCYSLTPASFDALGRLGLKSLSANLVLTDESLLALVAHKPPLQVLHMGECDINDDALETLAIACPGLEEIEIADDQDLTDAGLIALAEHCKKLRYLALEDLPLVTDSGLHAIATACPDLVEVSVRRCHGVTQGGVTHLVTGATHLKLLMLTEITPWARELCDSVRPGLSLCSALAAEYPTDADFEEVLWSKYYSSCGAHWQSFSLIR